MLCIITINVLSVKAIETGIIISIVDKSEIFVYFTITAATWSINKIIPVSIALLSVVNKFTIAVIPSTCMSFSTKSLIIKPENS